MRAAAACAQRGSSAAQSGVLLSLAMLCSRWQKAMQDLRTPSSRSYLLQFCGLRVSCARCLDRRFAALGQASSLGKHCEAVKRLRGGVYERLFARFWSTRDLRNLAYQHTSI